MAPWRREAKPEVIVQPELLENVISWRRLWLAVCDWKGMDNMVVIFAVVGVSKGTVVAFKLLFLGCSLRLSHKHVGNFVSDYTCTILIFDGVTLAGRVAQAVLLTLKFRFAPLLHFNEEYWEIHKICQRD